MDVIQLKNRNTSHRTVGAAAAVASTTFLGEAGSGVGARSVFHGTNMRRTADTSSRPLTSAKPPQTHAAMVQPWRQRVGDVPETTTKRTQREKNTAKQHRQRTTATARQLQVAERRHSVGMAAI